jgi:hypothetical protein
VVGVAAHVVGVKLAVLDIDPRAARPAEAGETEEEGEETDNAVEAVVAEEETDNSVVAAVAAEDKGESTPLPHSPEESEEEKDKNEESVEWNLYEQAAAEFTAEFN